MEEANNNIISQSIYCYEGTNVLKNKRNLKSKEDLNEIERGITAYKLSMLYMNNYPFKITLDEKHYIEIHKYLFGDIYDFAGVIREESIYKSNEPYANGKTPFCYPSYIYQNLRSVLFEMQENVRKIKDEETLITFLSHYYSELNIIHPFREGNGRTLREFMREYVLQLNKIINFGCYEIEYSKLNKDDHKQLLKGSIISSITDNNTLIEDFFRKVLVNKKILDKTK